MSDKTVLKKYLLLIEELHKREVLNAYDDALQTLVGVGQKQIDRMLTELTNDFDNIIQINNGKRKEYKLVKPIDIFQETLKNSYDIGWLFQMAHDADPGVFCELEKFTKQNEHIYQFKNTPFEDIKTLEAKDIFKKLQIAVKNREYKKIKFISDPNIYDNLKCLKLIFMDSNWYLAFVDNSEKLRFGRVAFIQSVDYASKSNSFQKSSVEKYSLFLNNEIENALTLYGVDKKIAKINVFPKIARYFEKDMKKFFVSQEFVEKHPDGSVDFFVKYTQPLELLPFVKKWLPNIKILEPIELRDLLVDELKKSIENQLR